MFFQSCYPPGNVILFDRGYPSFDLIAHLNACYKTGHYVFRHPTQNSFGAVDDFIESSKEETTIFIDPTVKYLRKLSLIERLKIKTVKVRIIKLTSPDGIASVLFTNLPHSKAGKSKIIDLYFKRWAVKAHYRNEKKRWK